MYRLVIVYACNYRREHVMTTADSVIVYVIYYEGNISLNTES